MNSKAIGAIAGALLFSSAAHADIPIRAVRIATGLSKPLFVTSAPGDPNRIFIVEQNGAGTTTSGGIRILDLSTGSMNASRFLTIPNLATGSEQGLLGLAFAPDYATSGKFYVDLTVAGTGQTQIRQYTRTDANTASTSFNTILTIDQPQANHNGGWMAFGPNDGYLYIGTGDGGNFNDQGTGHTADVGNAQDKTTLLGKMLRLDVTSPPDPGLNYAIPKGGPGKPPGNPFAGAGDPGRDEIWAYGLRNPWRDSFDRANGNLYIGDVGQDAFEEIDFQPASSVGGENYGWRAMEGDAVTGLTAVPPKPPRVDPIHTYVNPGNSSAAVTGGYVYRGSENDALKGTYFFADYAMGKMGTFVYDPATGTKSKMRDITSSLIYTNGGALTLISSFGEDANGNLYVTDLLDGEVYRLKPALPGDANVDDKVDITDLYALASHWKQSSGALWANGDFTDDGIVNAADLGVLASHWQQGVNGPSLSEALAALGLPTDVVPEPGALLSLPGLLLLRRRGQSRRARRRRDHQLQTVHSVERQCR
jgi:glucose/arabinose dehydrogenase